MPRRPANFQSGSSSGDRRGLFSCLYSKCDDARNSNFKGKCMREVLHDLILDIYEEAFDRLPVEDMPDDVDKLVRFMREDGLCVGLLDPVSNIILNTISLLPRDFRGKPPPRYRRKSKRLAGTAQPKDSWSTISWASCHACIAFMMSYFGCLGEEQATRYLLWAGADLALAVLLVEHDLYAAELALPDPASERTQAALKCAAIRVWHPAPDILVQLQASPLPQQRLLAATPFLKPGGRKLTVDDVNTILSLLRYQDGAPLDLQVNLLPGGRELIIYCRDFKADEGKLTNNTGSVNYGGDFAMVTIKVERHGYHFASLRSPQDKRSMISTYLAKAAKTSRSCSLESCGDACEYTESLKMRLHGTIHVFYLKVFCMLPSKVSRWLIRDILFAGHCYGPMDPVSNIIINSIWHKIVCPFPWADSEIEVYDILDTLSMLRVEVHSLKGLIALVQANSGCSMQRALEHLCCKCCDLSQERHTLQDDQFAAAAAAAQHPQHAALGSFLASLTPHMLDNLRLLLSTTNGTLSSESLDRIECILTNEFRDTAVLLALEPPNKADLCKEAEKTLLRKRSRYNNMKLFIRSELAQVLQKYASEHPREPKYEPSVICGVEATRSLDRNCYHVNFVAASESGADNELFFAELNVPCPYQSKPNFCCPLRLTYTGRCYYGKVSARKIVYPDSSDYFECDITSDGTNHTDGMLDADFIFDFRRDAQFAEDVRQYYEHQKFFRSMMWFHEVD